MWHTFADHKLDVYTRLSQSLCISLLTIKQNINLH